MKGSVEIEDHGGIHVIVYVDRFSADHTEPEFGAQITIRRTVLNEYTQIRSVDLSATAANRYDLGLTLHLHVSPAKVRLSL
jgi:hypothetical protein